MAETQMATKIAAVRFQPVGKLYHFDASGVEDLKPGDYVIVSTSRGRELGEVVRIMTGDQAAAGGKHKPIERRATPRDLVMRRMWANREVEAMIDCREKASQLGYEGLKIIQAEYAYDGSRLTFYFSSEGEERRDLGRLQQAMRDAHRGVKVDFRQIGPRDAAKILSGMGACGLVERCCSKFLTEFSPISIRMAKAQGISLNPQEITGMCGRLRCCLLYEYEQYVQARKELPKKKKRVITPRGEGRVVDVLPLKQAVIVQFEDGRRAEFLKHELQPYDELKALEAKAGQPCERHGDGECDCGRSGNGANG